MAIGWERYIRIFHNTLYNQHIPSKLLIMLAGSVWTCMIAEVSITFLADDILLNGSCDVNQLPKLLPIMFAMNIGAPIVVFILLYIQSTSIKSNTG